MGTGRIKEFLLIKYKGISEMGFLFLFEIYLIQYFNLTCNPNLKMNRMKKGIFLVTLLSVLFFVSCNSGSGEYDTRAVESLDKVTKTISDLTSKSYTVNGYIVNEKGDVSTKESDVYLRDSNKMFIENTGTKGAKSFWYNGEKFAYFLFDKDEYDIIDAPDNTQKLIDSIHSKFGINFPAADFLNPYLTDDILDNYDQLLYFGEEEVDSINCISIEATNEKHILQVWIEKDTYLPYKMVIQSKINENKYYEAVYTNWTLNPKLPDIMFEFLPPEGSKRKKIVPTN